MGQTCGHETTRHYGSQRFFVNFRIKKPILSMEMSSFNFLTHVVIAFYIHVLCVKLTDKRIAWSVAITGTASSKCDFFLRDWSKANYLMQHYSMHTFVYTAPFCIMEVVPFSKSMFLLLSLLALLGNVKAYM